ncbi:MAG: enoyl-CoA hydratase-related protein [Nitrospiraceae bacterium]
MKALTTIQVELRQGMARVILNRPDRRNAFDQRMVDELHDVFEELAQNTEVRGVILTGAGPVFCAGADLRWLKPDHAVSMQEAQNDAERLINMYRAIDECPHPVIGRIQGAAFGGGVGLMSVCDIVVTTQDAMFALSEVRLGLVPAVIAPFLLRRAGTSFTRRFCLTAETFSASVARQFNLVHDVVEPETLDSRIGELVEAVLGLAPEAARHTKVLLRQLQSSQDMEERWKISAVTNARARLSAEAQEGLRAFFEKRPPTWTKASGVEMTEPRGVKSHHVAGQRNQ